MSYLYYKVKRTVRNYLSKSKSNNELRRIAGHTILTIDESSKSISSMLESPNPCMIARIGTTEMGVINNYFDIKYLGAKGYSEQKKETLVTNSGFFGNLSDDDYDTFAEIYLESSKMVDGLCILTGQEEYVVHKYMPSSEILTLRGVEPYYSTCPWTTALAGKTVLVIHPFSDSIEKQYKRHEFLFKNKNILPEFNLVTLKAVQTIAGEKDERFDTWFDALDYMTTEALKIDFDVAIIGCGAYGFPLAARIKDAGRKAVHMGGATQVLFGIKGRRWDEHPVISRLYNEYWIRPGEAEVVEKKNNVENGCYW